MSPLAVDIRDVSKNYGRPPVTALKELSLAVKEQEKLGIIGPNGSGKTTLIRLILGFVHPDSGDIAVFGNTNRETSRGLIGFVPERQQGMENFTPRELLHFAGRMQGMPTQDIVRRCRELLEFTAMQDAADRLIGSFSRGMAQRTHIAAALIHQPRLLLLDEAFSGVDPGGQADLGSLLAGLEDVTLLLATHQLQEVEALCDRTVIMNDGQIAESMDMSSLKKTLHTVSIDAVDISVLQKIGVKHVESKLENNVMTIQFAAGTDEFIEIIQHLRNLGVGIHQMRSRSYLEEIYQQYNRQSP